MKQYDDELRGVLFKNEKGKDNPKAPQYRGNVTIGGVEYGLAAWIREAKSGQKYMSLSVTPPKDDETGSAQYAPRQAQMVPDDDDCPF